MILDHIFQNGTASANCRLQVMPSSEKSDSQLIFLKKEEFHKSMVFQKYKTLKAEKAVRSGDNQAGLEMLVFQSTPMWPSWDSSPPALL